MSADEAAGRTGDGYAAQARWIGSLPYLGKKG
jgi:hypothetical protein